MRSRRMMGWFHRTKSLKQILSHKKIDFSKLTFTRLLVVFSPSSFFCIVPFQSHEVASDLRKLEMLWLNWKCKNGEKEGKKRHPAPPLLLPLKDTAACACEGAELPPWPLTHLTHCHNIDATSQQSLAKDYANTSQGTSPDGHSWVIPSQIMGFFLFSPSIYTYYSIFWN